MAKNAPTVTLLLNGLDVPNQVIQTGRTGASVKLSVETDPPLETLSGASVDFANPDPETIELAGRKRGEREFRLKAGAPSGIAHRIKVTVRAAGHEAYDEKIIYALREASPQIRFEPSDATARGAGLSVYAAGIDLGQGGSVEPHWTIDRPHAITPDRASPERATVELAGRGGSPSVRLALLGPDREPLLDNGEPIEAMADVPGSSGLDGGDDRVVRVTLQRSSARTTNDTIFWSYIRTQTNAMSGRNYIGFINNLLCPTRDRLITNGLAGPVNELAERFSDLQKRPFGTAAYEILKVATEIFMLTKCGALRDPNDWPPADVVADESSRLGETLSKTQLAGRLRDYLGNGLPYLDRIIEAAFPALAEGGIFCGGLVAGRVERPLLLELIWSYWHEEGMLVQSMNAISRRFQNIRSPGDRDPLAHLEIDPLRPLNNLLWGYIQDELNRLSVPRRSYEYDHHYGLTLYGKAVPESRTADSRSKFLEGFHNLLYRAYDFYKEDSDTTVIADGYPLLSALKEVHLLLAQGAHNQFGDLPWTSRAEMLMQQWLLAQPQMREFLQSRPMVPYNEPWMAPVDTMKTLQGWSDVTITHFNELAVFGEQILLSVRYGDWVGINDEDSAKNWARYWRPEVQGYIHAYRTATGVDLSDPAGVDYTLPSVHLRRRLALQQAGRSAVLQAPARPVPRLEPGPSRRRALPSPGDFR